jgi:hypothetical protein
MTDIATLLAAPGLEATTYPPTSRYHGLGLQQITLPDGRQRTYLQRRFIPQADDLQQIGVHAVRQGERIDIIAADSFGDPTQAWRLCDANGEGFQSLVEPVGRGLKISIGKAGRSSAGA